MKIARLDAIRFAAEPAVAILTAVQIMRSERDKAAIRQPGGEIVVRRDIAFDHILRDAAPSVLANHYGPPLARLEIFWQ